MERDSILMASYELLDPAISDLIDLWTFYLFKLKKSSLSPFFSTKPFYPGYVSLEIKSLNNKANYV